MSTTPLTLLTHSYKSYSILVLQTQQLGYIYRVQIPEEEEIIASEAMYLTPEITLESAKKRIERRMRRLEAEEILDSSFGDRLEEKDREAYLRLMELLRQLDSGD